MRWRRISNLEILTDPAERKAIADVICLALTVHATIEEEIFYPTARDVIDDLDLLDEAVVEHEGAKILIAQIQDMSPDHPMFVAKVSVLGDQIAHHVAEEEGELFPQVRESKLDLAAWAQSLRRARTHYCAARAQRLISHFTSPAAPDGDRPMAKSPKSQSAQPKAARVKTKGERPPALPRA